jgi:hypothetical protein
VTRDEAEPQTHSAPSVTVSKASKRRLRDGGPLSTLVNVSSPVRGERNEGHRDAVQSDKGDGKRVAPEDTHGKESHVRQSRQYLAIASLRSFSIRPRLCSAGQAHECRRTSCSVHKDFFSFSFLCKRGRYVPTHSAHRLAFVISSTVQTSPSGRPTWATEARVCSLRCPCSYSRSSCLGSPSIAHLRRARQTL